jgi:hypothetical protein
MDGAAAGLEELAGLINFRVGAWQDFGYAEPPTPDCATIPPLGERSATAIEAGHEAIKDIDQLIARLHQVRAQLVSELRQDEDIRAARADELLRRCREVAWRPPACRVCGHRPHPETPVECAACPEGYCEARPAGAS